MFPADISTRSKLFYEFCVFQIQTKYLFLLFVTSSLKSWTSIKTANISSSWNFEWSNLETSSSEIPRYLFINYRNTGTRIPKNISPLPYSPFPVLKNLWECSAISLFTSSIKSLWIVFTLIIQCFFKSKFYFFTHYIGADVSGSIRVMSTGLRCGFWFQEQQIL